MQKTRSAAARLRAVRRGLLAGLSLTSLASIPTMAFAQDEASDDEIVVTGSRIRQDPLAAGRPVLNLDEEALDRSGLNSVGDFLQRIPSSGGGLNSKVNSSGNFGNPPDGGGVGAGSAEIDLRYLGSRRTLVLVDGLRWVNGASASGVPGATDLNTIPSSIIERIEVLQDGASPIYGSDAIAGVVNIITKQEQDGFAASAQVGAFDEGDGVSQDYQLSWGVSNDRTRIFFAGQYVHQNGVDSADRDLSDFPVATLDQCINTCSSATPFGRFLFTDPMLGFQNLTLADGFQYTGTNPVFPTDFKPFTTADRFNFSPFNYILTPQERVGFMTQVTHDISDAVEFRAKALYNNRQSVNQAAPIPLFIGPFGGNGNRMDTISIDATNPFNPLGYTLDAADPNGYGVFRRFFEAGPRHFEQNVDTYYVSGTFSGELGNDWFWDASAYWSRNSASQIANGIVNSAKLEQALGPVAACTGSCVPFNVFGGPGSITQAMVDFVTFDQQDASEQEIWDLQFNFGGDLFNLWAGPLSFAAGFEHRDQSGFFSPDPVVAAGDTADIPAQPTSGDYNVEELYGEFNIPLINDIALADSIEANFAIRHSTYSTGFKTTAIKYGGRWRVSDELTIRGGFTEGFRAASIGELFGTASRFDALLNDPCSAPVAPAFVANCATLGVPPAYTQINAQISVTVGGNPNLQAEESDSWNVGLTYAPEWDGVFLENFVAEANYYDIEISGAIQALDAQLQLTGCAATLDPGFCNGIVRNSAGFITAFSNQLTNIGGINTRGLDWSVAFDIPLGETNLGVQWNSTRLFDYTEITPTSTGFLETSREGRLRSTPQQAFPKLKSSLTADWDLGALSLRSTWRYISGLRESCIGFTAVQAISGAVGCSSYNAADDNLSTNRLKPKLYMDVAASLEVSDRMVLTVGVNNVLDTDPPPCFSCQAGGFDPAQYDVPGQFGYVRLVWRP
jgi:iron complex outermembrane receptor protein